MLDAITARLLSWYSLVLLILIVGNILPVANLMRRKRGEPNYQDRSVRGLITVILSKLPEGKLSGIVLIGSSFFLYCQVFNLPKYKHDLSLLSLLLHLGSGMFIGFFLACAALISTWIDSGSNEQ